MGNKNAIFLLPILFSAIVNREFGYLASTHKP